MVINVVFWGQSKAFCTMYERSHVGHMLTSKN